MDDSKNDGGGVQGWRWVEEWERRCEHGGHDCDRKSCGPEPRWKEEVAWSHQGKTWRETAAEFLER
jgi:hypothetical protein